MNIVMLNIKELKEYGKNPRKNDSAVEVVKNSIKEFGFKVPIIVDKEKTIVAGHTRYKASKQLGLKEVPCIIADDLTEEQIKAFRLVDNKTSEFAEWDFDLLFEELQDLDFEMEQFGFEKEFEELETHEDDYQVIEPEEPKAKLGDIYQLGNHRVMCGDSTDELDVANLMGGEYVDLVFTDPPYGMKKENEGIVNDNLNYDDLLEFNKKWISLSFKYLKEVGSWYCWGIDEPLMDIYSNILKPLIKENKITFRNLITWDKGGGQGQLSELFRSYSIADEKCLFVMMGVQGFNNNSNHYYEPWDVVRLYLLQEAEKVGLTAKKLKEITGVSMYSHWFTKSQWCLITEEHYLKLQQYFNDAFKREYGAFKREYDEIKREYYSTRAYFDNTHDNMNNVWHFNRTSFEERKDGQNHATPKPIELCSRAIKSSSRKNEKVLDLFGGSGSTLIACEQLNRSCYMMEYDPKFVDVIIQRWEKFTGKKAIKL